EKQVAQSKLQASAAKPAEAPPAQNQPAPPAAASENVTVAGEAPLVDVAKAKPQSLNLKKDGAKNENYDRSQAMFQENKLSVARTVAQEAIDEDQSQELAGKYHHSGINYQNQRQFQTAIVQYELVLRNYPTYAQTNDVLQRLADSYVSLGQ